MWHTARVACDRPCVEQTAHSCIRMPLASDAQAGATVLLSSALNHTGWDPGLGPDRPHYPPSRAANLRTAPLNRAHSRLTRHERLKTGASAGGSTQLRRRAAAQRPERAGFGSDCRRSEHERAAEDADTALWAWRRRSAVDIDRMMAAQRDDRAYHRQVRTWHFPSAIQCTSDLLMAQVSAMLGTDWPQQRSVDRPELRGSAAAGSVALAAPQGQFSSEWSPDMAHTPPGNRSTSWELEYEFHTAAARTAELRQLIAEREAQWDGFVSARPMEPHEALRTYEQQQVRHTRPLPQSTHNPDSLPLGEQVLLHALRKEAAWLRQALRTERQSQPQPGSDGGCPIDFPGGRQLAKDVAIAWSPAYAQAWTTAADSHGQMMQQYAPPPAVVAPTGAARWAHA